MKKLQILFLAMMITFLSFGQTVEAFEAGKEIADVPRKGMSMVLELDNKFVEKLWEKKIKEFKGKRNTSKGVIYIENAEIPEISNSPVQVITKVSKSNKGTEIWWAIDLGSEYVTKGSGEWGSTEKLFTAFGRHSYIQDITEQIGEAEKALEKSTRDHEKKIDEGEDLVKDIEDNKEEKIKLENDLKENGEELVQLEKDLENNKKEQEQAVKEVEKMKKALEVVKAKLDGVK